MSPELLRVKLWEIQRTDKAILFGTLPKSDATARQVWLPLSQIEHITRAQKVGDEWIPCIVTLPLWLADEKDL